MVSRTCLLRSFPNLSKMSLNTSAAPVQVPQSHERSPSRLQNPDHIANTGIEEESTYVLTLRTDPDFHKRINNLRKLYFPAHLNKIGAHITLFHALPGSQLDTITSDLLAFTPLRTPFPIRTLEPMKMAYGVALNAKNRDADGIFSALKETWGPMGGDFLSKQDQHFKAHYTIQNKATKEVALATWEEVKDGFRGDEGTAIGLTLYQYLKGGHWKFQRHFDFAKSTVPAFSSSDFPALGEVAS